MGLFLEKLMGAPEVKPLLPCRHANDAEIGLFADLIGVDSAL